MARHSRNIPNDLNSESSELKSVKWPAMKITLILVIIVLMGALITLFIFHFIVNARPKYERPSIKRQYRSVNDDALPSNKSSNTSNVCFDHGCISASNRILDAMDTSVDPCVDFHQFTCGNFDKFHNIPEGALAYNAFSTTGNSMDAQIRSIVYEPVRSSDLETFKMVKNMYLACMNDVEIEKRGLKPMYDMLQRLGGWPLLEGSSWTARLDWSELVVQMRSNGYSTDHLVEFKVLMDGTTQKWNIHMMQVNERYLNVRYLTDLAVAYGADREFAQSELEQAVEFQKTLQRIGKSHNVEHRAKRNSNNNNHNHNVEHNLFEMSIEKLNSIFPYVSWLHFFQGLLLPTKIHIHTHEKIFVHNPVFFEQLGDLLQRTPKRVIANYLVARAVEYSSHYMNHEIRAIEDTYIRKGEQSRKSECLDLTKNTMFVGLNAMYARKYLRRINKKNIEDFVSRINKELGIILGESEWMDEETKERAINKLNWMDKKVAYPDEMLDDNALEEYSAGMVIDKYKYLESILQVNIHTTNRKFELLRAPINSTDWTKHAQIMVVNAFYVPAQNYIVLPSGILQAPFYSEYRPMYMNYGTIGTVIGHEFTHGFDDRGSQHDEHGKTHNWWEQHTRDKFLAKSQCMIDQYSNFTESITMMTVNGVQCQGEIVADNGGIKESYMAYNQWASENPIEQQLPGLDYTPQQMFWIAFSSLWCGYASEGLTMNRILNAAHPPGHFRVIGALSNSKDFASDFNCPIGSPMNPVEKCSVW